MSRITALYQQQAAVPLTTVSLADENMVHVLTLVPYNIIGPVVHTAPSICRPARGPLR